VSWGSLNPALTAWRNAIERRLGAIRGKASDGALADGAHESTSQHQKDRDGTVDAFDMDTNVLGSSVPTGTPDELRVIEAMKLDFEQDPHRRGQLWISRKEIANKDIGGWREREYDGRSPHTEHTHWESDQDREHIGAEWPMPHTDRVLAEMRGEDMPDASEVATAVWGAGFSQGGRRETAGERLAHVDVAVDDMVTKGEFEEFRGEVMGKLDELLARTPDDTPAQRIDQ